MPKAVRNPASLVPVDPSLNLAEPGEATGVDFVEDARKEALANQLPVPVPTLAEVLPEPKRGDFPVIGDEVEVFIQGKLYPANWYPAKVVESDGLKSLSVCVFVPYNVPVLFQNGVTQGNGVNNWRPKTKV